MAEIVARKLVENGQERILQRLFDGVTSDLTLDVSDYKESDEHKLLHLVWRKYPRKRSPTYGHFTQTTERTNISNPTQITVDPNVSLFPTPPVNSTIPNANCLPAVEKGPLQQSELDYLDDSGSFKGSRLKGQRKKIWYPKSQPTPLMLSNRFDCLANAECPENFHLNAGSSDLKSTGSSRKGRHRGSSNALKSKTQSSTSRNSSNSELSENGSVERSNNSSERDCNVERHGTVTSKDTLATGTITMGILKDIPFRSKFMHMVGSQVKFNLEYISGKPIATCVGYCTDHEFEELSSGPESDTYD